MIGFFDSGYGGLLIMKECRRRLPQYDFVYFGDNARAPYGSRSPEEIFQFTLEGVRFLFAQGCPLVILACNTSSAVALRRIQQEILPQEFPDRRVLGLLVPTVEQVTSQDIAVFATPATVATHAYAHEITKRIPEAIVTEIACPNLVPLIESGAQDQELAGEVQRCVAQLDHKPQAVLLGCTHYPLVRHHFEKALGDVPLYDQASITAKSLKTYLDRHPEIEKRIAKSNEPEYFTSDEPPAVGVVAQKFLGDVISFRRYAKP